MAVKARKKAKKTKARRKPAKAAKRAKTVRKAKKAAKVKAKKKAPARSSVVKSVKKTARRLVAAAKRVVSPKTKDVIGEGNYTAARNFRKKETAFIDNNRETIARKAKEAEAAIDGPEGAELERAREETAAHGRE
jgi:hypothetical protein